jgi:GntR family transcriptional repressor for pyruvate dehydrogenase complex
MPESPGPMRPLTRRPLYEQITERLTELIDVQQLQPGDRITPERELAQQLGVSRHSVRQSLAALRATGVVEVRHGDGVFLARSPKELVPSLALELLEAQAEFPYIWEVRQAFEAQTARFAARRRTDADLRRMGESLEAMEASVASGEHGVGGDRRFHEAVAAASHNPLMVQLMEQLADAFSRTSEASLSVDGQASRSLADHREILQAIERQDEAEAAESMRRHLEGTTNVAFVRDPD